MARDRESNDDRETIARYEDWPLEDGADEEAAYVGVTSPGFPVYHRGGSIVRGEPDEDRGVVHPLGDTERELGPGETLAEVIGEIGETIGWDSLSEYGRERREDE